MRKIIHVDMDCFFAAIECRDRPELATQPVGVGGSSARGVLTTCNYIAREYGCRSAMPVFKARQLCPQLVIVPTRFEVYQRESERIRQIFRRYTDRIQPLSLDEAFLDVSGHEKRAWQIAREIRQAIFEETQLTASAGLGPNKMLAKIASDWRKPNGQFVVLPDQVEAFMKALPPRRIPGIGPKAAERLESMGISTCGDLQKLEEWELAAAFGQKWAHDLYQLCRGIDDRPVETTRIRKSISTEHTLREDVQALEDLREEMYSLLQSLEADLERVGDRPVRSLFVKLKFSDFSVTTCERSGREIDVRSFEELLRTAFGRSPLAVRLIGVGVRFVNPKEADDRQLGLALGRETEPMVAEEIDEESRPFR